MAECTSISAIWCPVHGDCACPRDHEGYLTDMAHERCPLHSPQSEHPIVSPHRKELDHLHRQLEASQQNVKHFKGLASTAQNEARLAHQRNEELGRRLTDLRNANQGLREEIERYQLREALRGTEYPLA